MQSWKAGSRGTQVVKMPMKENELIYSLLIDDRSQSVFAATSGNKLNQIYQVDLRNKKTIKKYSGLRIGYIQCLSSLEDILFVGGGNCRFTLISIVERWVLTVVPVLTPIRWISSSQFTVINGNNNPTVVVSVSGSKIIL